MQQELMQKIDPLCHVQGPGTTNKTAPKPDIGTEERDYGHDQLPMFISPYIWFAGEM